ncbi:MAG: hypothetical protein ACP5MG_03280 [Verrucomicrobiia bacterium]
MKRILKPINMIVIRTGSLFITLVIIASTIGYNVFAQQNEVDIPPQKSRLGINLAGPADWNTEHPFIDVFKLSRKWISQKKGMPWGKGPELERDENGWIKRLEPDCWAETPILTGGHAPVGEYVCLYDGEGEIDFTMNAKVVSRAPGRIVVFINAEKNGTFLAIRKTNPQNYVRNIRVIMPGQETTYKNEPFTPQFLKRWRNFNTIRFMDWMETNGSKQKSWKDRPTPDYCNYTEKGVPVEVMADLCNRLSVNAWFCMPHMADDDYVRQFAALVKKLLKPELNIYIEYSNEVWNSIFEQNRYAQQMAKTLGIPPLERPWEGAGKFYAQRSVEIFRIWQEVFGNDKKRLVRVIAWQAASGEYWSDKIVLSYNEAYKNCDAFAIAPYFSMNISPKGKPDVQTVAGWTVEQVLDYARTNSIPESVRWMKTQKKVADKYNLRLICYEAGQHFVGVGGGENNEQLTKLLIAANKHPRMAELYKIYLDEWKQISGDLMCIFSSVGTYSKWGSWGLLETADQSSSPKYDAVIKWIKENPKN